MTQADLTAEDRLKIAKSRDLFDFGVAVYELMIGKTSKGEQVQ